MKIGLGLYRHLLTRDNFRFARQCGCTHIVAHLVDYFRGGRHSQHDDQPTGGLGAWGLAGDSDPFWSLDYLQSLVKAAADEGLVIAAIENFDPAHWYDVLLDGPSRQEQIERLQNIIRNLWRAGIGCLGYNFSIAGVAARITGPFARGQAIAVGVGGGSDEPIPTGWYDHDLRSPWAGGAITQDYIESALGQAWPIFGRHTSGGGRGRSYLGRSS
jgi:mannonate dehydratase